MEIKEQQHQKGFTMVELMVVVGILGMIATALFAALRLGEEQAQTANLRMTIQDSAREGLYRMIQEIRQSAPNQVLIGGGGATVTFNIPNPASPVDGNYNVDWGNSVPIQYAVGGSGTQVVRTNLNTLQQTIIANDVVGLNFTGNGAQPTLVTVTMSVQRNLINGRAVPANPLQISGQAEIRNT